MIQNILIVCIGNICRSPIGEIVLADRLKQTFPELSVRSAGLAAMVDKPADTFAQELMQQRGLDLSGHRARQISHDILRDSDLILTMTSDQQSQIETQYPSMRGRVHRLCKWSGYDVPDPFKRPKLVFEQALALIDEGVDEWCHKLWN